MESTRSQAWGGPPDSLTLAPSILRLQLNCSDETQVKIMLSRAEKEWKSECGKDVLGCMIGFYIYTGPRTEGVGCGVQGSECGRGLGARTRCVYGQPIHPPHPLAITPPLALPASSTFS